MIFISQLDTFLIAQTYNNTVAPAEPRVAYKSSFINLLTNLKANYSKIKININKLLLLEASKLCYAFL